MEHTFAQLEWHSPTEQSTIVREAWWLCCVPVETCSAFVHALAGQGAEKFGAEVNLTLQLHPKSSTAFQNFTPR